MKIGDAAYASRAWRGQDRWVFEVPRQLFAVADGVSGSRDGGEAAEVACATFAREAPAYQMGIRAVIEALPELYRRLDAAVDATGSQTTFTGGVVTNDGYLAWLHSGDSRLFRVTKGGELYDLAPPQHDPDARGHLYNDLGSGRRYLTLGPNDYNLEVPYWGWQPLAAGDQLVFATDGVGRLGLAHDQSETDWWLQRLRPQADEGAIEVVERIVRASDIQDDGTLIVAQVTDEK